MTTSRDGGGKPLEADFLGRFEHPDPLVIDGNEIEESVTVLVEKDRIIVRAPKLFDGERVYKHLTEEDSITYDVKDDKTRARAVVYTGTYEGRIDLDGNPYTPLHHTIRRCPHAIVVHYGLGGSRSYAQLNSELAKGFLKRIFEKHWRKPEKDTMTTDDDHDENVDYYYKEMREFVDFTTFNRVVTGSSEVPPIDDDHPIIDHPIIDHPIIPDIPVDNTKDETDGPLIGKWDLVPKDGDGGGVLPLAVGGGAALLLLLMVK